jgi:hypothetical protein
MWLMLPEKMFVSPNFFCDLGAFARVKPAIFTMAAIQSWRKTD